VQLRQYLPWLIASVVGAALVTVVAFATESMTAVLFTGLGAGIVAGGVISASQRRKPPGRRKQRKRR
jgi:hypothetical protein